MSPMRMKKVKTQEVRSPLSTQAGLFGTPQRRRTEKIVSKDGVQYLWGSLTLTSRDSFLAVLEFLPLKRIQFTGFLQLLKSRGGKAFFDQFVKKSYQFHANDFWPSKSICIYEGPGLAEPQFIPALSQLLILSTKALEKQTLTHIICHTSEWIYNLTFVFAGSIKSPPDGTYPKQDSLDTHKLPKQRIGQI